jgi:hypothetical protein
MKKDINIGGIIFHIEEDGYDKLREYLETTQRIAASYNDRSRVMAVIENRIAETFLNDLKDGLQVVTVEDVEDLLATKDGFSPFNKIIRTNYIYLL